MKKRKLNTITERLEQAYITEASKKIARISIEKEIEAMDHVDDFIIEARDHENTGCDGWAGFNTDDEPHRHLDDL